MIQFTRLPGYDINGNPRYVCHYLNLLTDEEKKQHIYDYDGRARKVTKYDIAVKRANKLGGRKYHTKAYGGGIVFQSYSIRQLEQDIIELVKKESGE
jgi:hypothetical protein